MSKLALQRIAENKAKHARGEDARMLDLGNCGIREIPDSIGDCHWIKILNFSRDWNNLDTGEWIKSENSGPPNIINRLPDSLSKLIDLKWLWLSGQYHQRLSFSNLGPVSKLKSLESLSCSWTEVSDLTPLKELSDLKRLAFSSSKVTDLSPLKGLKELRQLVFHTTDVKDLSPLENLSNLEAVLCYSTKISDLTPLKNLNNLVRFSCARTNIFDLSPVLPLIKRGIAVRWETQGQDGILVQDCPLFTPPPELVKSGNDAILKYFAEIEKAQRTSKISRLAEAKCLIIGEGGAGKTSLAYKLIDRNNPLPSEGDTTRGIEIHPYDIKMPNGTNFRLNIWDFGGQEIYHATHQFFLTKRSLYLLLDDTRKDEKTVNDPTFNYWLQMAELYGGSSPLLIVQNEKGDRSKQLDLYGMQGRFGFVKDVKATNLLTCRGLDEVWDAIQYHLRQLPHIGEIQPKSWVDIRRELERISKEENRDHISLEEYYQVCACFTIPEKDRALFLSSYLHDFGAFLHFQDHPLLRKMLVLNNQWATNAVYKVLNCEDVKQTFGRFSRQDLSKIWAHERYINQHDELLALMEKFELCYKLPDEKTETWLAPQLLSVLQPAALEWDNTDNLQVRYDYEFMPKGLLSQHIVRMHCYVRQPDLAWKSGAVFERSNSQALVIEAWGSRKISLRARGPQAKELITLLAEDFDKMHVRSEGLRVKKLIPCNCWACGKTVEPHFYEYDDLIRRKELRKRTIECKISFEDVPVLDLLDGVFAVATLTPHYLLKEGRIEEALRQMEQTEEVTSLLGQIVSAERAFNLNQITYEELELVRSKARAAAAKLL